MKLNSIVGGTKTGSININSEESTIKSLMALNRGKNFCQLVPARTVASLTQVFFALEQTFSAFKTKTSFSKQPELEFLIHLYGTKQISKALAKAKLKNGSNKVLLICAQKNKKQLNALFSKTQKELGFKEKKFALGKNKKELMKLYGISEKEQYSLADLKNPLESIIIEKNSLVVFQT